MSSYNKAVLAFGLISIGLVFSFMIHNNYLVIIFFVMAIIITPSFIKIKNEKRRDFWNAVDYFAKIYGKKREEKRFINHFEKKK